MGSNRDKDLVHKDITFPIMLLVFVLFYVVIDNLHYVLIPFLLTRSREYWMVDNISKPNCITQKQAQPLIYEERKGNKTLPRMSFI